LIFFYIIFVVYFAELLPGIREDAEAGTLPANVVAGMEGFYNI